MQAAVKRRRRRDQLNEDGTPKETRRDKIILYIATYATDHHNAPSSLEIAKHFGIAQQTVWGHLKKLIDEGRLEQVDGKWKLPRAKYEAPTEP